MDGPAEESKVEIDQEDSKMIGKLAMGGLKKRIASKASKGGFKKKQKLGDLLADNMRGKFH